MTVTRTVLAFALLTGCTASTEATEVGVRTVNLTLIGSRGADGRVRQNLAFAYAMAGDLEASLQVSRRDLDEVSAQRQLQYFMQLRALPVELRSAELRRNPNFFPQSAASG